MTVFAPMARLWNAVARRGTSDRALDLIILQTLDALGPLHGYAIARHLEQVSSGAVDCDLTRLYLSLKRLEQRGHVRAKWDASDTGRRVRFYAILASGRRRLATEKAEWDRRSIMHRFLREHDRQKRELEIAREVQQRLFPQSSPAVAGLEYAGACRPAHEVGGDYYDFIAVSHAALGIAIGDVSGKGISAALLMATLRASLRALTSGGSGDVCGLMANLNRLVYESSSDERYATFFYGHFDGSTGELTYVNGGHHPPLLFRGEGSAGNVLKLDVGGPVVGLLPECSYERGTVRIDPGDVMVAFTDGISEAMNADDSEWGEPRLLASIQANQHRATGELIRAIMADVDRHVGDTPQYDDMTLVVLRGAAAAR
jgi:DNA-binding PadR family transcriptional regulator